MNGNVQRCILILIVQCVQTAKFANTVEFKPKFFRMRTYGTEEKTQAT